MTGSRIRRKCPSRTFDAQEALKIIQRKKPYSELTARLEQTDPEDLMDEALDVIIPWLASVSVELSLTEHYADVHCFNRICLRILECGGECGLVHLLCAESYLLRNEFDNAAAHLKAAEAWAKVEGDSYGYDVRGLVKARKLTIQIIRALYEHKEVKAEKLFKKLSFEERMEDPFLLRHMGEARAFLGFFKEEEDHELFEKNLSKALETFGHYFVAGGSAPRAYQVTGVILSRLGNKAAMIETLEEGLDSVVEINDSDGVLRLSVMCRAAVIGGDRLCPETPKAYALVMTKAERIEWMRSQYERGDEGKRAILEVTSAIPLDNFGRVELDFIARAALDMQDSHRLESVLNASGDDSDGNPIRLSLVCGLFKLKGDWKEARRTALLAARMLFDGHIEQHFAVDTGLELFTYVLEGFKQDGDMSVFDTFIGEIKPEWGMLRELVSMTAAGEILESAFGSKEDRVKKAAGLLEALPEGDRDADWYFLMLRCLVLAEDYDEAKKVAAKTRKFLDEYAKNQTEQAEAEGYFGPQSELNMLRRNLAIIETILKNHDSIEDFFDKSAVAEIAKSNLKVERMIPNPNGPAIMVCSHPVDKHIVRIVCVAALAMKHVIEGAQDEVTEAVKLPVLTIAVPAEEAKKINAGDWRVLILDAVARQMNNESKMPEPGYMVMCTSSPTFPNTPFAGMCLCEAWDAVSSSLNSITIYELVPLYANECDFAALYGPEKLLERLQQTNFWPVSIERADCCATSEWRPLIPKSQILPMIEGPMATAYAWVTPGVLQKGEDIGIFYRRKPDGAFSGWVFLGASERMDENFTPSKLLQIDLNTLANYAPYIVGFLDAEEKSAFRHDGCGSVSKIEYGTMKYAGIPDTGGRRLS